VTTSSNGRKTRTGKVVPLHKTEPLLKTVGFSGLLELIEAEDLAEAKELLSDFAKCVPNIDNNGYALAYLFGVMQGKEDIWTDLSKYGTGLFQRLKDVHELGRRLGFTQAMMLLNAEPKKKDPRDSKEEV
jgi:hypothetical protein